MQKVYMDAQAACGLKVGDYVRVVRKAENNECGWGAVWVDDVMDKCIRCLGRVEKLLRDGIIVKFSNGNWYNFPYFVLEKVEKPANQFKPFDKVLVRDNERGIWGPALFSHKREGDMYPFRVIATNAKCWKHCIPYEGNEHLCGTSDPAE